MPRAMLVSKEDILSAVKELGADDLISDLEKLNTAQVSSANMGTAPSGKTQSGLSYVLYADGHGEMVSKEYTEWICPVCNWFVGRHRITSGTKKKPCNFCTQCGQRIDWSGIDLGEDYEAPMAIAP